MKIGIVGNGFVGKATALFSNPSIDIIIYDINPNLCKPVGTTIEGINYCDLIFICVPTPMGKDGECCTKIVENCISSLTNRECIVVRSTVPVNFCEEHKISFMPEFLTEKNWEKDFYNCTDWIVGTESDIIKSKIKYLICEAKRYNCINSNSNIHFVSTIEASLAKYARNSFLATKVAFFNEIYRFCKALNVDYGTIKKLIIADSRIGESHTEVPGHDGKTGFGGTCLPKDIHALQQQMVSLDYAPCLQPIILEAVIKRNETIDRPDMEWKKDIGRASL